MRGAELLDKIGLADPEYVAAAHAVPRRRIRQQRIRLALAACLALTFLSAAWVQVQNRAPTLRKLEKVAVEDVPGIRRVMTFAELRQMMNYDGIRYIFLENGAAYSLAPEQLGASVGVLEYDMLENPEGNDNREFSTSYALGGTVYRLTDYHPAFRVAVEWKGTYYICQSVAYTDGSAMDVLEYFQNARFPEVVEEISVYNYMEDTLLGTIPAKNVDTFVKSISQAVATDLDSDGYQQISQAQKDGQSYRLSFNLSDGTDYWLEVIPSLGITMIGDGYYTLPDTCSSQYEELFDKMK